AGINVVHVPFRGTAAAITAVMAHHTDFAFSGFAGVDEQIKAGKLRVLATTGSKRNAAAPDLPTIGETLPGFAATSWWAMWVRSEVPAEIRDQIARDVRAIIADVEVQQRLRATGLDPEGTGAEELRVFMNQEVAKLRKLPPSIFG